METVIYLFSNAEVLRKNINYESVKEPLQLKAEKFVLSVSGERHAQEITKKKEFNEIEKIYTSPYVRAIATAKYLAEQNSCSIIINEQLGERKIGILGNMASNLFHQNQIKDFDFKLNGGESLNQVKNRMSNMLKTIITENEGKAVAVYSHQIAIMALLTNWCAKEYSLDDKLVLSYQDEVLIDETWDNPEVFKLVFADTELKTISRLS